MLAIAGQPMPSARSVLKDRLEDVFDAEAESATGAVTFKAFGRWCFSPSLYAAAVRVVARADFLTMHSLFSYPVLVGYHLARRHRKPYGVWPHGVLAPIQRQVGRRKKAVYSALLARRILDSASVLFFSARGERDEAMQLGLRAPSLVIPHGIDTSQFAVPLDSGTFRQKYLGGFRGPMVLYLGRLNAKKGIDLLIAALAQVRQEIRDTRLVIAGAGHPPAFVGQVHGWLTASGIADATVMTGLLDEKDKRSALADCDVFVMPSVAENFGFSLFEAMACRRAVVCSETIDYAREVLRCNAGIVAPRTPRAFAEAIVALLRDPDRRRAQGENGFGLAKSYSWDACGERLEAAVMAILTKQPLPATVDPA